MDNNPFSTFIKPERINEIIEQTLLITLNPEKSNLYLISNFSEKFFNLEFLEFSFFERILSFDTETSSNSSEGKVIVYLHDSFQRVQEEIRKTKESNDLMEVLKNIQNLIIRNTSTILKQPALLSSQDLSSQFLEIFKFSDIENVDRDRFLSMAIGEAMKDKDDRNEDMLKNTTEIFFKCFDKLTKAVRQASMINLEKWIISFLNAFVSDKNNPTMANIFVDYISLNDSSEGVKYSETLLGNK